MAIGEFETALVTGAASGMGRAVAAAFRERDMTVHALDRSEADLRGLAEDTGCIPHVVDLRDLAAVEALATPLDVDVLVNNAGVLLSMGPLEQMSPADVDSILDVNLRAPVHLTRLCLPSMVRRDRGHVFMLGSSAGITPHPNIAVYGATKAAIHMLCRSIRCDLIGANVRVTEIVPGRVQTRIYEGVLGGPDDVRRQLYDNFESIQPADIARLVVTALEMPEYCDVTMLEVFPTQQTTGGGITHKSMPA